MNAITGVSHDLVMMYCSEFCQIGFTLGLFFGATVFSGVRLLGKIIVDLIEKHKKVDKNECN